MMDARVVCQVLIEHICGQKMQISLHRLRTAFPDLPNFVEECAQSIEGLYGAEAASFYRHTVPQSIPLQLQSPSTYAWQARVDGRTGAIFIAAQEGHRIEVTFIHVLEAYRSFDLEVHLLKAACTQFHHMSAKAITVDFLPLCPLNLNAAFQALSFRMIPRALMRTALSESQETPCQLFSEGLEAQDDRSAAETLAATYQDHPDAALHAAMTDKERALAFIKSIRAEAYGPFQASLLRRISREDQIAGLVLGTILMPGAAFVLQLVVHPDFRGSGLGRQLMHEYHHCCRDLGLRQGLLGVSLANPALRLYESLGYSEVQPVQAYIWEAPAL